MKKSSVLTWADEVNCKTPKQMSIMGKKWFVLMILAVYRIWDPATTSQRYKIAAIKHQSNNILPKIYQLLPKLDQNQKVD